MSHSSSNMSPRFSIHWWLLPEPVFTMKVTKCWFSNSRPASIFTIWHPVFFCQWNPLPPIYLLLVWTHELLQFLVVYNSLQDLVWCSDYPTFGRWKFLQADFCVLVTWPPPILFIFFLSISLLSSIIRCYFGCICTYLCQVLETASFLRIPKVILMCIQSREMLGLRGKQIHT